MLVEATKFNYAIPKNKLNAYKYKLPKISIQQQIQEYNKIKSKMYVSK